MGRRESRVRSTAVLCVYGEQATTACTFSPKTKISKYGQKRSCKAERQDVIYTLFVQNRWGGAQEDISANFSISKK